LFALVAGKVSFDKGSRRVNIIPSGNAEPSRN
jgi:hypothetical protein